jgi:hypothetical protein
VPVAIPKELDEAALVDGASYRQILLRVFIPVALPGLIAATIFAFTVAWAQSQFLYPLAFTTSADQLVLSVGVVTTLVKSDVFNWGQIMAGALLGAAPPLLIYCFPDGLRHRRAHGGGDEGVITRRGSRDPSRMFRFARQAPLGCGRFPLAPACHRKWRRRGQIIHMSPDKLLPFAGRRRRAYRHFASTPRDDALAVGRPTDALLAFQHRRFPALAVSRDDNHHAGSRRIDLDKSVSRGKPCAKRCPIPCSSTRTPAGSPCCEPGCSTKASAKST